MYERTYEQLNNLTPTQAINRFHVGQEVRYTGPTTRSNARNNVKATIDIINQNSKTIFLIINNLNDKNSDNNTISNFNEERATINMGDLVSGSKKIEVI